MQEDDYQRLKEKGWRQRLGASELDAMRKFLADKPGAVGDWERDEALSRLLEQMPPVPVSSNFTARVVANVGASEASVERDEEAVVPWFFRSWWARLVAGTAMVCAGFFSFQAYATAHRAREARELAAASQLAALPPMEWLNDFDTIQRLDKVNVADDDLLSVLE